MSRGRAQRGPHGAKIAGGSRVKAKSAKAQSAQRQSADHHELAIVVRIRDQGGHPGRRRVPSDEPRQGQHHADGRRRKAAHVERGARNGTGAAEEAVSGLCCGERNGDRARRDLLMHADSLRSRTGDQVPSRIELLRKRCSMWETGSYQHVGGASLGSMTAPSPMKCRADTALDKRRQCVQRLLGIDDRFLHPVHVDVELRPRRDAKPFGAWNGNDADRKGAVFSASGSVASGKPTAEHDVDGNSDRDTVDYTAPQKLHRVDLSR